MKTRVARELPILFTGAMVRAIMEWRKCETRRVILPPPTDLMKWSPELGWEADHSQPGLLSTDLLKAMRDCPYRAGDQLYVRESYAFYHRWDDTRPSEVPTNARVIWQADGDPDPAVKVGKWRPSIFMPKWAARHWLQVIEVRRERVQDITDDGAEREGAEPPHLPGVTHDIDGFFYPGAYRRAFQLLWNSINAKRGFGWSRNPEVWVVLFRRRT